MSGLAWTLVAEQGNAAAVLVSVAGLHRIEVPWALVPPGTSPGARLAVTISALDEDVRALATPAHRTRRTPHPS